MSCWYCQRCVKLNATLHWLLACIIILVADANSDIMMSAPLSSLMYRCWLRWDLCASHWQEGGGRMWKPAWLRNDPRWTPWFHIFLNPYWHTFWEHDSINKVPLWGHFINTLGLLNANIRSHTIGQGGWYLFPVGSKEIEVNIYGDSQKKISGIKSQNPCYFLLVISTQSMFNQNNGHCAPFV